MIHTSIASSLQAPIKTKQIDIKCSPALGLHLLAKSAVQHSSQVLSTGYLTLVLAYNLLQLTKIWQHYYTFWAQNGT
jgi:hypothetical protein